MAIFSPYVIPPYSILFFAMLSAQGLKAQDDVTLDTSERVNCGQPGLAECARIDPQSADADAHYTNASIAIAKPVGSVVISTDRSIVGEPRFPSRSRPVAGMILVEFSTSPEVFVSITNAARPPLDLLESRPDLQEAYDAGAKPGEFVTPPSIAMSEEN